MKYISLQDLIDYGKELRFQSADQMKVVYDRMPGIEIVRCKDCKHFNDGDCEELPKLVSEDDFCSFAERGTDE